MDRLQNIPAFKFAALFAVGIIVGSAVQFNLLFLLIFLILLVALSIYTLKETSDNILQFTLIAFTIISGGIFKSSIDFYTLPVNSIVNIPDTKEKTNYEFIGIIKEVPDYDSNRVRFIAASSFIVTSKDSITVTGDVMVTVRKNKFDKHGFSAPELRPGDKVSLLGKLGNAWGLRNPGEFDYREYLRLHNIHRTFTVLGYENAILLSHNNLNFFHQYIIYPAKSFAVKNIDEHIKGDAGAYLKGLVTGDRSGVSSEVRESFVNTGVMHLLAVSGLNVAYIILTVTLLLSLFRVPKVPSLIITITVLLLYCFFTGSPASIIRATVMGILFIVAVYMERKPDFYNLAGAAAAIILMIDAKQLFDAGFILSFTAVIMMVYIYEKFNYLFLSKISYKDVYFKKAVSYAVILFFTTIAAQVGTLPLTAMFFGKISFISFIANLVAVPLSNLSLALGLFQVTAGVFSGFLASIIAAFNGVLLNLQLLIINWFSSLTFAYIDFYRFNLFNTIIYFIIIFILLNISKKNLIPRLSICAMLVLITVVFNTEFGSRLKLTFFDVGEADCTLIETPDGKVILVDAGTRTDTYDSGERTIVPYLKRHHISKIDLLILSSIEPGYTGGAEYIVSNFPVGKVVYSSIDGVPAGIRKASSEKNISMQPVSAGDMIDGIKDIRLYFLHPISTEDERADGNTCVVVKLKHKETEYLFTGSIQRREEKILSRIYGDFLKTDVLKVAAHGSSNSNSEQFLNITNPSLSVISSGLYNRKGNPDEKIIQRIGSTGSMLHRTDVHGACLVESDGYNINIIDWK